jgi:hypothetical protein
METKMNLKETTRAFLYGLSYEELQEVHSVVWDEMKNRIEQDVASGKLEPLSENEKKLAKLDKLSAVRAYRDRRGLSLLIAKTVVEKYLSKK